MSEAEKYEVLEKIGHGSFGVIRKVRRKLDGQVLCRKEINYIKMSTKEREQLHAEFAILSSLKHPNIVGYYHREHLKSTQDLHLYMEYCGNGDLGRVIKDLQDKRQYAEEGFVWSIFSQLVAALYRCHYGIDPPEVGSNCMGLANTAKPKKQPAGGVMILHRDLKPENVFLGDDNSVKLGDFGLSKIMQAHDFASTYVGTPFYMSPEICAAERYTLKSDIWSLGCIIYELCAKEPPFNATTHFHLIQKIKEGKIAPLPSVYSPELTAVIKDCLKVNPDRRPDTASLLNLPVVKLMRKEKEVVELGKLLKTKEELVVQRLREAEEKLQKMENEKVQIRHEIDSTVRREWEVKARLEIDRQVSLEMEKLSKKFESEVQGRVELELEKRSSSSSQPTFGGDTLLTSQDNFSSIGSGDGDFPSSTECTEMSLESPVDHVKALRKSTRTPFGRAQTMFNAHNTPMDIEMGEPSPISLASLALSPRRAAAAKAPVTSRNIFAGANLEPNERWQPLIISDSEDDEDLPTVPSPTRVKSSKNPLGTKASNRPPLMTQKTAPIQRGFFKPLQKSNPSETTTAKSAPSGQLPTLLTSAPDLAAATHSTALKQKTISTSPTNRRLSKIPSSANLQDVSSPTRKTSLTRKTTMEDMSRVAMKNNMVNSNMINTNPPTNLNASSTMTIKSVPSAGQPPRGRTLVELAQARAGGRPVDSQGNLIDIASSSSSGGPSGFPGIENGNASPLRSKAGKNQGFAARMAEREVPFWDPERDEMPSPFLSKGRKFVKGL